MDVEVVPVSWITSHWKGYSFTVPLEDIVKGEGSVDPWVLVARLIIRSLSAPAGGTEEDLSPPPATSADSPLGTVKIVAKVRPVHAPWREPEILYQDEVTVKMVSGELLLSLRDSCSDAKVFVEFAKGISPVLRVCDMVYIEEEEDKDNNDRTTTPSCVRGLNIQTCADVLEDSFTFVNALLGSVLVRLACQIQYRYVVCSRAPGSECPPAFGDGGSLDYLLRAAHNYLDHAETQRVKAISQWDQMVKNRHRKRPETQSDREEMPPKRRSSRVSKKR